MSLVKSVTKFQAFEIALARYGPPLQREDIHPDTAPGFEEFLGFFRKYAGEHIHCDWVRNDTFNALATTHAGFELIGIFGGATIYIYNHFYCFLNDQSVFPHIGDPLLQEPDQLAVAALRRHELSPLPRIPQDAVRKDAAMHLAWNAVMFLFFHELAHIRLCHIRLLFEHVGIASFLELPVTPISPTEARLRVLLEIDADQAAAKVSRKIWNSMWEQKAFKALAGLSPEVSWSASIAMLFQIMDAFQPSTARPQYTTHPPPIVRFIHITNDALQTNAAPSLGSEDNVLAGLLEVSKWWDRNRLPRSGGDHGVTERVIEDLNVLRSELANNYSDRLNEYQDERRRKLSGLA